MVTETDRAWLAGIWDGEGTISLFTHQEKEGHLKIKPLMVFVNTDIGIINQALKILDAADCKPYITKRQTSKRNSKHKDCYEVRSNNIKEIEKMLKLIEPYLYGDKKAKSEILLRFAEKRILKREKFGRNDLATYDEEDFEMVRQIRSSTTTRETPKINCSW